MEKPTSRFRPVAENLVEILESTVATHGKRPAFGTRSDDGRWTWLSYADFGARVDAVRSGLHAAGVRAGDRVGLISRNRIEWAAAYYATQGLGAAAVPMYEAQRPEDWAFILGDSRAHTCLCGNAEVFARVSALRSQLPALKCLIDFDAPGDASHSFAALERRGGEQAIASERPDAGALASIIYTSGTTGRPKGVRLSHYNLASNVTCMPEVIPFVPEDRSLSFLPWAHVFGGNIELNGAVSVGGAIAICAGVEQLLRDLTEVRPTVLFAVPRVWNRMYDGVRGMMRGKPRAVQLLFEQALLAHARRLRGARVGPGLQAASLLAARVVFEPIRARFGGRLRYAITGGAALSREVAELIDAIGITVYEGYGMTESSGLTVCNTPAYRRLGSVGKPAPGVRIELDPEVPGADGERGEGEIIIHSHGVMQGYEGRAEATAEVTTPGGGLRTGDLGRFDDEGFLYVTGRVKELYKLENGKYVAPVPIEEALQLSPYIAQAMVCGANRLFNVALLVPDLATLEGWARSEGVEASSPAALLEAPEARALIAAEVRRLCEGLRSYERVRAHLLVAEPFSPAEGTLTPTLKLRRREVLSRYGDGVDALYDNAR